MNKHDERRKQALIRTLRKAREQADTAILYLGANDRDMDDIYRAVVALEHIGIALEHLCQEEYGPACRVCGCTQNNACPDGCWWVEPDLCSSCVGSVQQTAAV